MTVADPGFRVIIALLKAKNYHRRMGEALQEANAAMWDLWLDDPACQPNLGVDATADTSDAISSSDPKLSHAKPNEEIPTSSLSGTALCHDFAPPPDVEALDEPPSHPV